MQEILKHYVLQVIIVSIGINRPFSLFFDFYSFKNWLFLVCIDPLNLR